MRISKVLVALISAGTIFGMGMQSAQALQSVEGGTGGEVLQACKPTSDAFVSLQAAPEIGIGTNVPVKAGYLRLWDENVAWRNLFPSSNNPDPTAMQVLSDRLDQAHNSGSKALYVFGLTPQWAAADPAAGDARFGAGSASPPSNPEYFDNYVRTVVNTYGKKIDAYELWNEGNIKTFWSGTPEQLADLTARAYSIIKAADPTAIVLAPSTTLRLTNAMNTFVAGFFAQAAKTSPAFAFDGFAIHSYPSGTGTPADRVTLIKNWQNNVAAALRVNATVLDRPIWDTEVNYGLAGPGATPATDYSDAQGAELLRQTYADSKALGIDATFWYLYTAAPFDLLGVQFWSGSPLTTAAWNETRTKWAPGAGVCAAPAPTAGSSGSTSTNNGGTLIAINSGPIVTVDFINLPNTLIPTIGNSQIIIGNQPGTCSQSSNTTDLITACGSILIPPCSAANAIASSEWVLSGRPNTPGLYVQILDGIIHLNNNDGSQNFAAGQFGYTPNINLPPVILPSNPGIQFTPPPSFTPNTPIPGSSPAPTCTNTARVGDLRASAAPAFAQGGVAMIRAGGFAPNTTVTAYLGKNSSAPSSLNTDAAGQISMWMRIPASTPVGATTIQLNGHLASKALVSITSGVTVRAAVSHVVNGTVAMDANQKKLNAKEKAALNKISAQVPATVPSKCTITATAANGKSIKAYYFKSGLTCSVKKSSIATSATVNVQFAN